MHVCFSRRTKMLRTHCASMLACLCCCQRLPHVAAHLSYLSIVKQQEAATASSGQNAIIFVISGVLVLAGSALAHALGLGWYMSILAAIHLTAASLALGQILIAKARLRQLLLAVPTVGTGM